MANERREQECLQINVLQTTTTLWAQIKMVLEGTYFIVQRGHKTKPEQANGDY